MFAMNIKGLMLTTVPKYARFGLRDGRYLGA